MANGYELAKKSQVMSKIVVQYVYILKCRNDCSAEYFHTYGTIISKDISVKQTLYTNKYIDVNKFGHLSSFLATLIKTVD